MSTGNRYLNKVAHSSHVDFSANWFKEMQVVIIPASPGGWSNAAQNTELQGQLQSPLPQCTAPRSSVASRRRTQYKSSLFARVRRTRLAAPQMLIIACSKVSSDSNSSYSTLRTSHNLPLQSLVDTNLTSFNVGLLCPVAAPIPKLLPPPLCTRSTIMR